MNEIGKNIEAARLKAGLTLEDIAKKIGVTRQAVSLWIRGGSPRMDKLNDIAKVLNVSLNYLLHGDESSISPVLERGKIPLVSWSLDMNDNNTNEWFACPVEHSAKTVALRVNGQSMFNPSGKPSFSENDIIFVDCLLTPKNGSLVVYKKKGELEGAFRQLIIEGGSRFLKALNPSWPTQIIEIKEEDNIEIIGVAILKAESLL